MSELNKFLMTDIEEIPEADVSNFEKKEMKKRLLRPKTKPRWIKKMAIAASIFIAASAMTAIAFPSVASQIPILQNIVSHFDEDELMFNHFSEVAQPLGLTETSNGSTVSIEEAVYDGTSVTISFALRTEENLGEFPLASGLLEASGANGSGSSIAMNKVNDTTYAGMITMAPDFLFGSPNTLKVSWEPESFEDFDTQTKLVGDWSFDFKLKALDSKAVKVGETIPLEGGRYKLNELLLTKLSTVLTLNKQDIDAAYVANWQLEDNLGNTYPMQFGTGDPTNEQFTFEALDPEATSVIIKPQFTKANHSNDEGKPVDLPPITVKLQ
ncbi:DUF4179 domain-containing protein [Planomicrobium sp. CPCC 101079]|uniref:DUF4179 domain-containing protein n=1 Tax=Planomicrobium sp. CPCC 101079 TaxID=2599618 RepID=UPI0011B56A9F|nr:DUF4179 domain-containing protein [Planomicrobium sp. CPCC 101079]TWT01494.1 DUF4179 domain-containing protein [Planomicrobium sp. CPCC 101079]